MTRDQLQPRGRDIGFMDARGLPAWVSSSLECACVPWKSAFLASVGGLLPPSPRSNSITDRMNLYLRGYGWVKVVRRRVQRGSWSQNWSFNYVRIFHKTCSKETYEWKWLRSDENFHAKNVLHFLNTFFKKKWKKIMFISACFFAKRIHKIDVNRYTLFEKENRSETIKFNWNAKKYEKERA